MAKIAGYGGEVDWSGIIDSDNTNGAHSWSLDVTTDMLDSTEFNSTGDRTFHRGLKSWTGTVEIKADDTYRVVPSDCGSSAALRLYTDGDFIYKGTALVNTLNVSTPVDGQVTISMGIQGTGALSHSDLS
jgi:hypothetical protein